MGGTMGGSGSGDAGRGAAAAAAEGAAPSAAAAAAAAGNGRNGARRRVRIGMDVGGTFTKAVAIETRTGRIVAAATVATTHASERGVSEGIVEALAELVRRAGIDAGDIEMISHSTTQAINALLEYDTHKVGVIAMGVGPEKGEVVRRTRLDGAAGRGGRGGASGGGGPSGLCTSHRFLDTSHLITEEEVRKAVDSVRADGAEAVVAAEAFGVDDPSNERYVAERAAEMGVPATASHEMSGAYGLEIRTLTAAVNASVLPKTFEVARYVEDAVRGAGVSAPLMIMKGDGGVADMGTFRTRPILTVLSGPAASVAGALLYLRVTNGVFVEVGGTSTNVCIIRDGKPEMRYVTVRDHPTCVRSLDVRILGVAGGSMVALGGRGKISRVGPRSAHIAGLPYACHAVASEIESGELALISPRPGDEPEYAVVRCPSGAAYAITNTCAANALGLVGDGDYAHAGAGAGGAARAALAKLGGRLGVSYSEAAMSVIQTSSFEITRVVGRILKEFGMRRDRITMIGGGGGASVLAPFAAKQLGIAYEKADHAEVISSIGVASSMMREEVEVAMSEPSAGRVSAEHRRVRSALVGRGAVPESVVVDSEFVPEKSVLRITAVGSVEMDGSAAGSAAGGGMLSPGELRRRASDVMDVPPDAVDLTFESDHHVIFTGHVSVRRLFTKRSRRHVVIMDRYGRPKAHFENGLVLLGGRLSIIEDLDGILEARISGIAPQVCLVTASQVMDFSGLTSPAHILEAVMAELGGDPAAVVIEA